MLNSILIENSAWEILIGDDESFLRHNCDVEIISSGLSLILLKNWILSFDFLIFFISLNDLFWFLVFFNDLKLTINKLKWEDYLVFISSMIIYKYV